MCVCVCEGGEWKDSLVLVCVSTPSVTYACKSICAPIFFLLVLKNEADFSCCQLGPRHSPCTNILISFRQVRLTGNLEHCYLLVYTVPHWPSAAEGSCCTATHPLLHYVL